MDCTIAALIACFNLSGLYIDSGLSWQDMGESRFQSRSEVIAHDWGTETAIYNAWTDNPANPYGRVALGYEVSFQSLTWSLEASHQSSILLNDDHGVNSVSLSARWYPFRSR